MHGFRTNAQIANRLYRILCLWCIFKMQLFHCGYCYFFAYTPYDFLIGYQPQIKKELHLIVIPANAGNHTSDA